MARSEEKTSVANRLFRSSVSLLRFPGLYSAGVGGCGVRRVSVGARSLLSSAVRGERRGWASARAAREMCAPMAAWMFRLAACCVAGWRSDVATALAPRRMRRPS